MLLAASFATTLLLFLLYPVSRAFAAVVPINQISGPINKVACSGKRVYHAAAYPLTGIIIQASIFLSNSVFDDKVAGRPGCR